MISQSHLLKPTIPPAGVPLLPTPGDETLAEAQLAEDVHHRLHGRVVGDGERAEVQDASQLQRLRVAGWQLWRILGEVNY